MKAYIELQTTYNFSLDRQEPDFVFQERNYFFSWSIFCKKNEDIAWDTAM